MSRTRRRRSALGWTLGLNVALAAAAGPALAEAQLRSDLRERLGLAEDFAIDLDLGGLELRGVSHELADGRGFVRASRVSVRPGFSGLIVEVEDLDGALGRGSPGPAKAPRAKGTPPPRPGAEPAPSPRPTDPIADALLRLRGIPVELHVRGQLRLDLGAEIEALARSLDISLSADGALHGDVELELRSGATSWARASVEIEAAASEPRDLTFIGNLSPSGPGAPAVEIAGRLTPTSVDARLRTSDDGQATIALRRGTRSVRGRQDRLTVEAEDLPLAPLQPLMTPLTERVGQAIGERDGQLIFDDARLSGSIELVRGAGLTRASFEAVELSTLVIASPLLAAEPTRFDDLRVDGELAREHTSAGPRSFGALVLEHRGVQIDVSGQLDAAGLEIDVQLPPTPCQAVLDAAPGISPVLAGTELGGELDAHFGLTLDFAALERARARYLGEGAETIELEDFEAPGELRFSLPYLERCTIERLGPGADVEGLRGVYHHDFVSAKGHAQRRVLAVGDEDYVPIGRVPQLALAFVILEDARYWQHDGFDREQIERAFWYNLLEGRVRRGASTITQQTARSLWLGIDRSLARKFAEALLTAELERTLDKRRILEIYLNIIELGPEIHGVTEAARYHFDKEPEELELIEALHLASLAPAPVAYSRRFADGEVDGAWREHLRRQVRRMLIRHLITADLAERTNRARLRLRPHATLAPATHPREP